MGTGAPVYLRQIVYVRPAKGGLLKITLTCGGAVTPISPSAAERADTSVAAVDSAERTASPRPSGWIAAHALAPLGAGP